MKLFYSYGLVTLQFVLIMTMFWTVDVGNLNAVFYILVLCGMAIGLSALTAMRRSNFQIIPDVSREASLVTNGPYKYIRHPMYSAILLACLGLLWTDISAVRLFIYAGLFAVLLSKMLYEERLLRAKFVEYGKYMKRTKEDYSVCIVVDLSLTISLLSILVFCVDIFRVFYNWIFYLFVFLYIFQFFLSIEAGAQG